ncbi:MAG: hypothetical protein WC614_07590 [bacterium]
MKCESNGGLADGKIKCNNTSVVFNPQICSYVLKEPDECGSKEKCNFFVPSKKKE